LNDEEDPRRLGDQDPTERPDRDERDGRDRDSGRDERESDGRENGPDDEDDQRNKGTPVVSPVTPAEMSILVDRLTVDNSPVQLGLINVNTASRVVLNTIPGLTEEQVSLILAQRQQVPADARTTTAWLVTNGVLPPETYAVVSNRLTTRSLQFTADVIGFADHVGTMKRIEAVIEMRGHTAQLLYYRDITSLGIGYPVKDDERSEGFAFQDG
jgi:hypothetical protein